ncbi:MAG: M56 family metallopeptidase [Lachnospiraceae bacterium]|nr:M56 family metallopeptidase [Lachnospiraceae bacterium]
MGIINSITLLILSSGVTGTIMSIVWILFCRVGKKYLHTKVINFALKIVLVSYFIPSIFIVMIIRDRNMSLRNSAFLFSTGYIDKVLKMFFLIIVLLFIIEAVKLLKEYIDLRNICRCRIPAELEINTNKERLSKKFKVKRRVSVYRSYAVFSPITYGVINPVIYFPIDDIEDEYMRVLLTHELLHNKQWDFIWKPLSTIARCIHWINPLVWILEKDVDKWSEASCDDKCCTIGEINQDVYFGYLYKTLDGVMTKYNRLVSHFKTGKDELIWREKRMAEEKRIKDKKGIVRGLELITLIISIMFVYIVSDISNKLYLNVFFNTAKMVAESEVNCKDIYDEEVLNLSEIEKNGAEFIELSTIASTDISGIITGDLRVGESGISSEIYLEKNINLDIAYIVEPLNKKVKIGIIQPDDSIRYISNDTIVGYNFEIAQSGEYKILIINESDTDINISISYAY